MLIDLRSDTLTKPTDEMLQAMLSAKVGDDVFDEDPSVNMLQEKTAKLFGKEAGLFCPSGTMTNQIAIKVHANSGEEIICDNTAHIYNFEGGGIAANTGASVRLILGNNGRYTAQDVLANINDKNNVHFPLSKLVVIEDTSNKGGGSYWDMDELLKIRNVCDQHDLKLHLDGARVFNALTETKNNFIAYGNIFDSISICLSKGLGAPVGSVLIGGDEFIRKAKRTRKFMGGGMRQAGYLAAAGIYALDHHIERLKKDHIKAKIIEETLANSNYIEKVFPVYTNIILAKLSEEINSNQYLNLLEKNNIRAVGMGHQLVRFVTHLDFSETMLKDFTETIKNLKSNN